jgi:predicted permease
LPLFLVMALGYLCRRLNFINSETVNKMNNVAFRIFIPVMVCQNILQAERNFDSGAKIFIFAAVSVTLSFLLMWLVVPFFEKDNRKKAVIIQGIGRSNYVLFGVPIVKAMCPDDNYSIAAFLVIIVIPLFNALSVVILEVYRGERASLKKILLGIIKNPLIIASAIGFILINIPMEYPYAITKAVSDVSSMATPLALFLLGASFEIKKVKSNIKPLAMGLFGKLILMPAIFIPIAILLGLRGAELASVIVIFGSPSAVNSYTMAQQMGADGDLAGEQVVLSSLFSIVTLFVIIFLCMQTGYV